MRIELSVSDHNEEPNGGDELIALKRWILEIVFAKDTLCGPKAFNES